MKKVYFLFVILLNSCLLLQGSPRPTANDWEKGDPGPKPNQIEAQKEIKEYMKTRLKDPYSAKYKFNALTKDYTANGNVISWGWAIYADFNTKNSYGAYTGLRRCRFFFQDKTLMETRCENNY